MTHLRTVLVSIATWGMVLWGPLAAARCDEVTTSFRPSIRDVSLDPTGSLHARLLSREGQPIPGKEVGITQRGVAVTSGLSDQDGNVQLRGLTGGQYELRVGSDQQDMTLLRVWTAKAAPPIASSHLLIVPNQQVERGQQPFCNFFGSEPLMIGVIVAAAIAIPIAVHESGS